MRWQVGLRTLLLLVAAVAVWLTYFVNLRHNASLELRIKALLPLAHELVVDDPGKIAAVKLEEYWFDENRWDVYLPDGSYRLCVATREIDDQKLAPAVKCAPIPSGRHRIALEQKEGKEVRRVAIAVDGRELLAVEEPKEWDPGFGSSGGGQYSVSEQFVADQPVVLFRRRFMRDDGKGVHTIPTGPTEGLMVWIEPIGGPKAER
jgi:hypothetical protein